MYTVSTWASKASNAKDEPQTDKNNNGYLLKVIRECNIALWEESSSKFNYMLEKLRNTPTTKILIFSLW